MEPEQDDIARARVIKHHPHNPPGGMRQVPTINSDIGIYCVQCNTNFTGQARYSRQVLEMYNDHSPCKDVITMAEAAAIKFKPEPELEP